MRSPCAVEEQIRQIDFDKVNYLLRLTEVWSRAYTQWIATSSQDAILLLQLESVRQNREYSRFFVHWSDPDFARIGWEIELLFKRKGWLR